jgi:hypothetical protein
METGLEGYVIDSDGKKTAVIIPIAEYETLLKSLQETSPEATIDSLLSHRELKATLSREWSV